MKFTDQLHQTIQMEDFPKRIISLVPSQTELLFDLGLDEEIAGITRYCILPQSKTTNRPKVGGTKRFNFKLIDELEPDLIIANKEENYPEGIFKLREKYPVWISDVKDLETALDMIDNIGKLVDKTSAASSLIREIDDGFKKLKIQHKRNVVYLIWRNPFMTIGGDTFIHEMLKHAGFNNIFEKEKRYPEINDDAIKSADVILFSSEPYPFKEDDVIRYREQFSNTNVYLVNGAMFSWYGSRLKHMPEYFMQLLQAIDNPNILSI